MIGRRGIGYNGHGRMPSNAAGRGCYDCVCGRCTLRLVGAGYEIKTIGVKSTQSVRLTEQRRP